MDPALTHPVLDDLVMHGLLPEISAADRCLSIHSGIGRLKDRVTGSRHEQCLAWLQWSLRGQLMITLRRLYEDARSHKVRSIPAAIAYLGGHTIIRPLNPDCIADELRYWLPRVSLPESGNATFTPAVARALRSIMDSSEWASKIRLARTQADKHVAHNEAIDSATADTPQWQDTRDLLEFAKSVTVIAGQGYLSISCRDRDGQWCCHRDATELGDAFADLIERGGYPPK